MAGDATSRIGLPSSAFAALGEIAAIEIRPAARKDFICASACVDDAEAIRAARRGGGISHAAGQTLLLTTVIYRPQFFTGHFFYCRRLCAADSS
jgi:hypothetical protein